MRRNSSWSSVVAVASLLLTSARGRCPTSASTFLGWKASCNQWCVEHSTVRLARKWLKGASRKRKLADSDSNPWSKSQHWNSWSMEQIDPGRLAGVTRNFKCARVQVLRKCAPFALHELDFWTLCAPVWFLVETCWNLKLKVNRMPHSIARLRSWTRRTSALEVLLQTLHPWCLWQMVRWNLCCWRLVRSLWVTSEPVSFHVFPYSGGIPRAIGYSYTATIPAWWTPGYQGSRAVTGTILYPYFWYIQRESDSIHPQSLAVTRHRVQWCWLQQKWMMQCARQWFDHATYWYLLIVQLLIKDQWRKHRKRNSDAKEGFFEKEIGGCCLPSSFLMVCIRTKFFNCVLQMSSLILCKTTLGCKGPEASHLWYQQSQNPR